jgi:hypothetical protein
MANKINQYVTVPINITGGTSKNRSRSISSERTVNFYQEFKEDGKDNYILQSFPGQKYFAVNPELTEDLIDRGMHNMDEKLYRVAGNKLIKVSETGVQSEITGTIAGTDRCNFATDGEKLVIVAGEGIVYIYDRITDLLTSATDNDLSDVSSVSYLNNQFLYTSKRFLKVSDVGNPDSINGLNIIGTESNPDDIVTGYVYDSVLILFGKRTIENWYNSGVGNPPFERIDGRIFQIGLASKFSIAETSNALYFLADNKRIYRMKGGQHEDISTNAIINEIEKLNRIDDASAFTFSFEGYNFYAITFPESNRTFAFNEKLGANGWFELNNGEFNEAGFLTETYNVAEIISIYNKTIMADLKNGNLYELDINTFTNASKPILRERVTSVINGKTLSLGVSESDRLLMKRLEIFLEKGTGNIVGDGDDPKLLIEFSIDGGKTFKNSGTVRIGKFGESNIKCEVNTMLSFYNLIIRIRTSDPVYYCLHSAVIDVKSGGR